MKNTVYLLVFIHVIFVMPSYAFNFNQNKIYPKLKQASLKEVTLFYMESFSLPASSKSKIPVGCIKKIKGTSKHISLRCREQIKILYPSILLQHWQYLEKKEGFVPLKIQHKNKKNIHAHITSIKPFSKAIHNSTVVEKIKHYAQIQSYYLKNIRTGEIRVIKVTPEHPFYVHNLHQFVAISHVTANDYLINSHGDTFHVLCGNHRKNNCGYGKANSEIVPVYNLRIAHRHYYFAGKSAILVHNCNSLFKDIWEEMEYNLRNQVHYVRGGDQVYQDEMTEEELLKRANMQSIDGLGIVNKEWVYRCDYGKAAVQEAAADKINYLYENIYHGKFKHYAVADACQIGGIMFLKTPFIDGTIWEAGKIDTIAEKVLQLQRNYLDEMMRLNLWISDQFAIGNLMLIDDHLIPIDFEELKDIKEIDASEIMDVYRRHTTFNRGFKKIRRF